MRSGGVLATSTWRASRGRAAGSLVSLVALGALVLTSCGTDYDDLTVAPQDGWQAPHGDARNSATSPVTGGRQVALSWSRPVGGPIAEPVTVGRDGQMFVSAQTANCAIASFQMATGRKRFCNPIGPTALWSPTLVDGQSNVYLGDDSAVNSFNYLGQPRWRVPVAGTPVSQQFTDDGNLLTITQSGQLDVLARNTGERVLASMQLLGQPDFLSHPDLDWPAADVGLDDCAEGGPHCAVANVSAMGADGRVYLTLWRPGHATADLVALRYADKQIQQEWSVPILRGGSATSPVLSADGSTLYVGDNDKRLIALDTTDGRQKWTQPLPWAPRGLSVSDEGLIIPSGDEGHLLAIRDSGDAAEIAWERKDLDLRGTPAQTAGDTGYIVAAIGDGLNLITFDTTTGATLDSDELPGAQGSTTGTAIGPEGEVVTATRIGEIFAFKPE
ncbi:PQQ-binding-like beta-propeller repeat protein [Nocardia callitridis]|uniref:PQQ-binding-like beta-propeller repeat protein n=1 Tax=Nocardia callitridis TaxID=648753 RepID=A0ABP9KP55_9NOCA